MLINGKKGIWVKVSESSSSEEEPLHLLKGVQIKNPKKTPTQSHLLLRSVWEFSYDSEEVIKPKYAKKGKALLQANANAILSSDD